MAQVPPEQLEKVKKFVMGIPKSYQRLHLKTILGKVSAKQAVKAKCRDCCAWENLADNIGSCEAITCPCWQHRPIQNQETDE